MSFKKIIGSVLLFTVLYSVPSFAQWFPYKRGYDQSQELQDIRDSEARIKARNDAKRAFDANPLNSREAYGPSQSAMRGNGNPTKELLAKKELLHA